MLEASWQAYITLIMLIGQSHDLWRAYSLFVARVANDATRDTNKLYARQGHVIIIIINTFGQIVQMYFIRTNFLTWNHVGGWKFHLQPVLSRLARVKERIREDSQLFDRV